MSQYRSSLLVRQVCKLLDQFPTAKLVVFLPRSQLGTALQQAVARKRGGTAGLTATTAERYAHEQAALALRADGQSALNAGPQFFLVEQCIRALSEEQRSALTAGQPLSGLIAPLARTFTTLRTHSVSPATYRQTADSERQRAQADAYAQYESLLDERSLYDPAALFTRATQVVESATCDVSATAWTVEDTVSLSTVERRFLEALRDNGAVGAGLYRLGPRLDLPESSSSPPQSAAAHFPDAPRPETSGGASPVGTVALQADCSLGADEAELLRFWTATGPRREVQAVFEDILDQSHPLDTVEIAYTSPDPYLPLLDTLAERYDIPVSVSGGRSIDATRPGQALRGFFDWISNGCPIPDLIALLRAGLLRLEGATGEANSELTSRHAATLLAEKRYPDDCRDYDATFDSWSGALASEAQNIEASTNAAWTDEAASHRREKREAIQALQSAVNDLLSLAKMTDRKNVSLKELAAGAEALLEEYGPTPPPSDEEDDRTPDQAARNRLIERLREIQDMEHHHTASAPRLAGRLTTWLGLSPFVQAQRPRPGRAHVVPLESAGYADRDRLYVVGLDADSTQSAVPDDPLLNDEEREALSDDTRALPLRRSQADVEAWRTRQALARHEGTTTLSASTYNLAEDEDLFESPLFLRLKEAAQKARGIEADAADPKVAHVPLAPEADTLLSPLDQWTSRGHPSSKALDEALTTHSWIQDGLAAAAARDADTYTRHDGLLDDRSYSDLDPLSRSRPVSAGRLETYAQAPYAYFLRYVLGVEPLDEPALDDVAWLDARGRGAVLHDTFRRFMSGLDRQPTLDDTERLEAVFQTVLDEQRDENPPPSEVVYASTRRQLWNDARLFLRAEAARSDDHRPHAFEIGFGYPAHRRSNGDYDAAPTLALGDLQFSLRGRIDRVDDLGAGSFGLWDYKTGSARDYDAEDLIAEDFHLQWALYAYAYEALTDASVATAGYFFTSTDEMGKRIAASPAAHRSAVARVLRHISEGISAGAFPVTDADALRYSYDRLFHDYGERRKQLTAKDWDDARPAPPGLRSD